VRSDALLVVSHANMCVRALFKDAAGIEEPNSLEQKMDTGYLAVTAIIIISEIFGRHLGTHNILYK